METEGQGETRLNYLRCCIYSVFVQRYRGIRSPVTSRLPKLGASELPAGRIEQLYQGLAKTAYEPTFRIE